MEEDQELGELLKEEDQKINGEYQDIIDPKSTDPLKGTELYDKLQNQIIGKAVNWWEKETADQEGIRDDFLRAVGGGFKNVGYVAGLPGISHTLRVIDSPFWAARQSVGAILEHGFGVDPRYGHTAVGLAELVKGPAIATKATKLLKGKLIQGINNYNPGMVAYATGAGFGDVGKIRKPPPGMTPKDQRGWFAKLPRQRVFEIGEELGGTKDQLRQIAKGQSREFQMYTDLVSELNHMWRVWGEGRSLGFENSQIVVKRLKDGTERLVIKDWKGPGKDWETFSAFNKDHIRAVINPNLPSGGVYGANMADNLEILFAATNRRKSNIFQLDERVLKNLGVPKNVETYIFRRLNPDYAALERTIPTFWRESYVKNILNDYYEQIKKLPKKRWEARMNQLVRKYNHLYKDKAFIEGLKGLQKDLDKLLQSNLQKGISGGEIPSWMERLEMPPGGMRSKDPWWLDLPKEAQLRWSSMAREKANRLMFDDPGYRPSKGRYRIQPDD